MLQVAVAIMAYSPMNSLLKIEMKVCMCYRHFWGRLGVSGLERYLACPSKNSIFQVPAKCCLA